MQVLTAIQYDNGTIVEMDGKHYEVVSSKKVITLEKGYTTVLKEVEKVVQ